MVWRHSWSFMHSLDLHNVFFHSKSPSPVENVELMLNQSFMEMRTVSKEKEQWREKKKEKKEAMEKLMLGGGET